MMFWMLASHVRPACAESEWALSPECVCVSVCVCVCVCVCVRTTYRPTKVRAGHCPNRVCYVRTSPLKHIGVPTVCTVCVHSYAQLLPMGVCTALPLYPNPHSNAPERHSFAGPATSSSRRLIPMPTWSFAYSLLPLLAPRHPASPHIAPRRPTSPHIAPPRPAPLVRRATPSPPRLPGPPSLPPPRAPRGGS